MISKLFLFFIFLSVISCSKHKPPEFGADGFFSAEDNLAKKSCSEVKIKVDLLEHSNVKNLFDCTKWSKVFPELYQSINSINPVAWNQLFKYANKDILEDGPVRNRMIHLIKELNEKDALEDLAVVLRDLNQAGINTLINDLLSCSEDENRPQCQSRRPNVLTKMDIEELFSLFKEIDESFLKKIIQLFEYAKESIGMMKEEFDREQNKLRENKNYMSSRILFLDALSIEKLNSTKNVQDTLTLKNILLEPAKGTTLPWFYLWLTDPRVSESDIFELLTFGISKKKNILLDLQVLVQKYKQGVRCQVYDEDGHYNQINLDESLRIFLNDLEKSDHSTFMKKSMDMALLLQNASEFCPQILNYEGEVLYPNGEKFEKRPYKANIMEIIDSFNGFLSSKTNFILNQHVIKSIKKIEKDKDPLFLLEFLSRPSLSAVNEILNSLIPENEALIRLLIKTGKKISLKDYVNIVDILLKFSTKKEKNDDSLAMFKFWNFLKYHEKEAILGFFDGHFKEDIKYMEIFEFYIKFLKEIHGKTAVFIKEVFSDKDIYNNLISIFDGFSSTNLKDDISRFLSKDYLVQLLTILAEGVKFEPGDLMPGIYIPNTISENKSFINKEIEDGSIYEVSILEKSNNERSLERCLKEVSNNKVDFYHLVENLPPVCTKIKDQGIVLKLFSKIKQISKEYKDNGLYESFVIKESNDNQMLYPNGRVMGVMDAKGIMAPSLINSILALLKTLEKNYKDPSGKNGLKPLLNDLRNILLDKKDEHGSILPLIEDSLALLNDAKAKLGPTGKEFLNDLIRKLIDPSNEEEVASFFKTLLPILNDFSKFVQNGDYEKLKNKKELYDPKYSCKNQLNQSLGDQICPDNDYVKEIANKIGHILLTSYAESEETPSDFVMKALIPDEGILLPLWDSEAKNYNIKIKEILKAFYDVTDKSLLINNQNRVYLPKDYKENKIGFLERASNRLNEIFKKIPNPTLEQYRQLMTTAERVEVTIRGLGFDDAYILVQLANGSSSTDNKDIIEHRLKLMHACIPLRFCGQGLNAEDFRNATNALASIDGVMDMSFNPEFEYGKLLQALMASTVVSSHENAQTPYLFSFNVRGNYHEMPMFHAKKYIKQHNVKLFYHLMELSIPSNLGRFIRDRMGKTRGEFLKYIDDEKFNLINDGLFKGFPLKESQVTMKKIFEQFLEINPTLKKSLLDEFIDQINGLEYSDLRRMESTIGNILTIASYIGDISDRIQVNNPEQFKFFRYKNNSIYPSFESLPMLMSFWPQIEKIPNSKKIMLKLLKPIFTLTSFFKKKLEEKDPHYYQFLNDLWKILNQVFFKTNGKGVKGLDIFNVILSNEEFFLRTVTIADRIFDHLNDLLYDKDKISITNLKKLESLLNILTNNPKISFLALKKYLNTITQKSICFDSSTCIENIHYNVHFSMIDYMLIRDAHKTKLESGLIYILKDEYDEIIEFLYKVLGMLEVKNKYDE